MLISPPFLPARNADETESAWLDRTMHEIDTEGMYPVARNLCWHGGVHLEAPVEGGQPLPVRAIADGVVRFRRDTVAQSDDNDHPLNYDYDVAHSEERWTSNGTVVIEHETEIGATADNTPVNVRFFSVYQHLTDIPADSVRVGERIYRKEEVGRAGSIAGYRNRIHFEIACDAENLERLIGRRQGNLSTDRDGRANVVFGEIYIRLPAGTPVYAVGANRRLLDNGPVARTVAATGAPGAPVQVSAEDATTTAIDCYVALRYAMGEGAVAQRGDLTVTTYRENGSVCGRRCVDRAVNSAAPNLDLADAEYKLYQRAKEISESYPQNTRPTPSAVYELLRFGRIINTTHETLTPENVPHWREIFIPTENGNSVQTAWVNLNNQDAAHQVQVFSDADFPHWRGWGIFDDDLTGNDSRCDSESIKQLLDIDGNRHVSPQERQMRMADSAVREKLRKAICSIPSEWDAGDLDNRWSWLKDVTEENPTALTGDDYDEFIEFVTNLGFAVPEMATANRRFHPRGFIETFRKSGWLSRREILQLVPSHAIRRHNNANLWEAVYVTDRGQNPTLIINNDNQRYALNRMLRKYGINTPMRQAGFFGNSVQETMWFSRFSEFGGNDLWYAPWYGRGLLQLTNPDNYIGYLRWRGRTIPESLKTALHNAYVQVQAQVPRSRNNRVLQDNLFLALGEESLTPEMIGWRNIIGDNNNDFDPFDSAGYYWIASNVARFADDPNTQTLERYPVTISEVVRVYYRSRGFWRVSAAVNLPTQIYNERYIGLNGFDSRCCAYGVAIAILTEQFLPDAQGNNVLLFPEGYTMRRP
jgi:hydroxyethylthiazole kinase